MSSASNTIDVPLTLHLSRQAWEKLSERAAASKAAVADYVSAIVEQNTRGAFSLEKLSGEVFQRFTESGTTDDELGEELERGKHELRAQRRNGQQR